MATALQIVQKYYPQVAQVVDATKGVKIAVTAKDAQSRAVKNHKDCALAVACKRQGAADAAVVAVNVTYLIKGDKAIRYKNPESISREITAFDRNAGFEPGEYHLAPMPPSAKLGAVYSGKSGRTSQKQMNYHRTENIRVLEK